MAMEFVISMDYLSKKLSMGYQVELPEQWLRNGQVWEVRKAD